MNQDSFKGSGFSERKLALLASMLEEEGLPQAPRLEHIPRDGKLPLSSAQMRLWLFDQLEPASSAYNIPVQHEFKGHFDLVAFERSLSEIVRRHEALRTSYLTVEGRPVQKINAPEPFP
ncbi:MAG: condensation domain-containing protein, partial [Candidatus Sulfotelmatobacter sp.]